MEVLVAVAQSGYENFEDVHGGMENVWLASPGGSAPLVAFIEIGVNVMLAELVVTAPVPNGIATPARVVVLFARPVVVAVILTTEEGLPDTEVVAAPTTVDVKFQIPVAVILNAPGTPPGANGFMVEAVAPEPSPVTAVPLA